MRDSEMNVVLEASMGIGDVITFAPMLRRLKQEFPTARITIMSRRGGFLRATPLAFVDEAVVLSSPRDYLNLARGGIDWLFMPGFYRSTQGVASSLTYRALFRGLPAKQRFTHGDLDAYGRRGGTRVQMYLGLLERAGLSVSADDHGLFLPYSVDEVVSPLAAVREEHGLTTPRVATVHIGSKQGYSARDWPIERWQAVLEHLWHAHRTASILIGASDDVERSQQLSRALRVPHAFCVDGFSLNQTTALIRDCDLMISTNSGPMWIAAALEKPQVALCGPSKLIWDPTNPNAMVLRYPLDRDHCAPPCDARTCAYGDNLCMTGIDTASAVDAVDRLLGKPATPIQSPGTGTGRTAVPVPAAHNQAEQSTP